MDYNIFDIGQYAGGVPWENLTKEYQDSIAKEEYIEDPHSVPIYAIEEYSGDYDYYNYPDELEEYIDNIIPDAHKYLVFKFNGTWDGRSGYKLADTKMECFSFNYDVSMYLVKRFNTVIRFKLHSHDVPMGSDYVILTLTKQEANLLEDASLHDVVISFAKKRFLKEEL